MGISLCHSVILLTSDCLGTSLFAVVGMVRGRDKQRATQDLLCDEKDDRKSSRHGGSWCWLDAVLKELALEARSERFQSYGTHSGGEPVLLQLSLSSVRVHTSRPGAWVDKESNGIVCLAKERCTHGRCAAPRGPTTMLVTSSSRPDVAHHSNTKTVYFF